LLTPRNHGESAWVYLVGLGGGLVDGDGIRLDIESERGTSAFVSTQSAQKVYRSPRGCCHRINARVAEGAALALVPDPVVCFSGARYTQRIDVSLAPDASLVVFDGFFSGRAARGERWQFARLDSRTTIERAGQVVVMDAIRLDPAHGSIGERMGRFDVMLSLFAAGPRFQAVCEAMRAPRAAPSPSDGTIIAASPVGDDAVVLRVAADRFESASTALRPSFEALARVLGDDPFARKW
jgi:urease accessory protein